MELHIGNVGLVVLAEDGHFIGAAVVFQDDTRSVPALLGDEILHIRDDTRDRRAHGLVVPFAVVDGLLKLCQLAGGKVLYFKGIAVERMRA